MADINTIIEQKAATSNVNLTCEHVKTLAMAVVDALATLQQYDEIPSFDPNSQMQLTGFDKRIFNELADEPKKCKNDGYKGLITIPIADFDKITADMLNTKYNNAYDYVDARSASTSSNNVQKREYPHLGRQQHLERKHADDDDFVPVIAAKKLTNQRQQVEEAIADLRKLTKSMTTVVQKWPGWRTMNCKTSSDNSVTLDYLLAFARVTLDFVDGKDFDIDAITYNYLFLLRVLATFGRNQAHMVTRAFKRSQLSFLSLTLKDFAKYHAIYSSDDFNMHYGARLVTRIYSLVNVDSASVFVPTPSKYLDELEFRSFNAFANRVSFGMIEEKTLGGLALDTTTTGDAVAVTGSAILRYISTIATSSGTATTCPTKSLTELDIAIGTKGTFTHDKFVKYAKHVTEQLYGDYLRSVMTTTFCPENLGKFCASLLEDLRLYATSANEVCPQNLWLKTNVMTLGKWIASLRTSTKLDVIAKIMREVHEHVSTNATANKTESVILGKYQAITTRKCEKISAANVLSNYAMLGKTDAYAIYRSALALFLAARSYIIGRAMMSPFIKTMLFDIHSAHKFGDYVSHLETFVDNFVVGGNAFYSYYHNSDMNKAWCMPNPVVAIDLFSTNESSISSKFADAHQSLKALMQSFYFSNTRVFVNLADSERIHFSPDAFVAYMTRINVSINSNKITLERFRECFSKYASYGFVYMSHERSGQDITLATDCQHVLDGLLYGRIIQYNDFVFRKPFVRLTDSQNIIEIIQSNAKNSTGADDDDDEDNQAQINAIVGAVFSKLK
jgi:hypothetical protein